MNLTKYLESNKADMDQILEKYLNISNKNSINKDTAIGKKLFYQEVASEEILKSYNSRGNDFQKELMTKIKPSFMENLQKRLNDKKLEDKQKDLNDKNKDKVSEATKSLKAKGVDVSKEQEEKISNKSEKEKAELTENDIENEIMKTIYDQTLDEYNSLRQSLYYGQNGQVKTGEIFEGEKTGVKLVLYENYLRKLDMAYKVKNKAFIGQDDKSIGNKENVYAYKEAKAEKSINISVDKNLDRINNLTEQIDKILEDINSLSQMSRSLNSDEFNKRMDLLQSQYVEKSCELSALKPSMLELHEQVEKQEKIDEFSLRKNGTVYDKQHDRKVLDGKNNKMSKSAIDFRESLKNESNETVQGHIDTNLDIAENLMNEFDEVVDEDPSKAFEILQSAKGIAQIGGEDNIKEQKEGTNDLNENLNGKEERKYDRYSSLKYELEKGKRSQNEILQTDIDSLKEEAEEVRSKLKEQRASQDKIR